MPALDQSDADLLITEIHHRFSNSLQIISALARQCERVRNDPGRLDAVLRDLTSRLEGFARVHRELSTPFARAGFKRRCQQVSRALVGSFGRMDDVYVRADSHDLSADCEDRLLLIVAELVTNVLKHSLRGHAAGYIEVRLSSRPGVLELAVSDSARSAVADRAPAPSRIVAALAATMGGRAYIDDRSGYTACVSLPSSDHDPIMLPLGEPSIFVESRFAA